LPGGGQQLELAVGAGGQKDDEAAYFFGRLLGGGLLFCGRGGRFGPHAPQWSMEPPFYRKLMVVSWFNAGARVIDVRDPFNLQEVAYYIPATTERTDERCAVIDGVESCRVAIQTNNVEVDDRGLIYLADRADTGLHIVELTGPAAVILEESAP